MIRRIAISIASMGRQVVGAWRITADVCSFLRLSADFFLYRILAVVRLPFANRERVVRIRNGVSLHYRLNRGDIWTIDEVWLREAYRLPFASRSNVLIDLGANIGLTTVWLCKEYGFRHVLAVEPAPSNARLARRNLADNGIPGQVVQAAVGPEDGTALFREFSRSTLNHLVFSASDRALPAGSEGALLGEYEVPVLSMPTLLRRLPDGARADLIKLDIEGGEQQLLTVNGDWLEEVDGVIAEFHPPHVDIQQLVRALEDAGHHQIVPAHGCAMECFSRPSREMTAVA